MAAKWSKAALGRALNPPLSGTMIAKLAARGMPLHSVAAAEEWRRRNLDQALTKDARRPVGAAPASAGTAAPEINAAADPAAADSYLHSRARRETAEADRAELEVRRLRGELVERAGVERAAMAAGRLLRDMVLSVPSKIAVEVAALGTPHEVEARIRDELRKVLADIARAAASGAPEIRT